MSVYVDEIKVYPNAWGPFKKGSCHMTADTDDELHALATKIGMKRSWFQDGLVPHYDLTPSKRVLAVAAGAIEETCRDGARRRMKAREKAS